MSLERLRTSLADRYRIERELGQGGMATVYLATDLRHDRPVAIKVLRPELAAVLGADRFLNEVRITARLEHPHIVSLLDSGERDGFLWYVLPFIRGESLRHRLNRERQLGVDDALAIGRQVAAALDYAHRAGVIHRDLKPENILLHEGEAMLADFGIALAVKDAAGDRLTETGLTLGTPQYMSPEQAAGERQLDARSDIYSLGAVLYEMLAGEPVFTAATAQGLLAKLLGESPTRLGVVRPTVPEAVERGVMRALAKTPADRFATAGDFGQALAGGQADWRTSGPTEPRPRARLWRRRSLGLAVIGALVVGGAAAAWWLRSSGSPGGLEPDLIAVAPFDTIGADLGLWREGMVDILARNFDGAGALRTVPPSVVFRRWSGRADASSAGELGRATRARLAVFGQLIATQADSVRVRATLLDVATGHPLGETEIRGVSVGMDRLADSLTVTLLQELGRSRPVGAVRATAFRATSLPALKAFLQGEQFFRRTVWDSALAAYRRAVALDSNLALAWRRMNNVVGWSVAGGDSLSLVYGLRAAGLNRGLAPRESLLITAESLTVALFTGSQDTSYRAHRARLYATLEQATRQYPDDPEAWYELGDAYFHFDRPGSNSYEAMLDLFDRSIALDSALGEPYIHALGLALRLGQTDRALRYVRGFKDHSGGRPGAHDAEFALVAGLLSDPPMQRSRVDSFVSANPAQLLGMFFATAHWADSQEVAVRIARAFSPAMRANTLGNVSQLARWAMTVSLSDRGHLREAVDFSGGLGPTTAELAVLGGVPAESAAAYFARTLVALPLAEPSDAITKGFNQPLFAALPWWSRQRDTASLRAFAARLTQAERRGTLDIVPWLRYGAAAAMAYLALARADTGEATRRFTALPGDVCNCVFDQIVTADLLLAQGRDREALAVFEGHTAGHFSAAEPLWRLTRARANERVGEKDKAIADYRLVVEAWRRPDPELKPFVEEATAALLRLTREPGR